MNVENYLNRIKFKGEITNSRKCLFELQKGHLLNIPFENLDIHYDKRIILDNNLIYDKLILKKRGGFCHELNGLFYWLLIELGFEAKLISAQVHIDNAKYGKDFGHMAIIVNINNESYLVDVGFGKFSLYPLHIKLGKILHDDFGKYQFDQYNENAIRINEITNGTLSPQYIFRIQKKELAEFVEMCNYQQTSKESHFTHKKVISQAKEDGRITLSNTTFKILKDNKTEEISFPESEFSNLLNKHFNIRL